MSEPFRREGVRVEEAGPLEQAYRRNHWRACGITALVALCVWIYREPIGTSAATMLSMFWLQGLGRWLGGVARWNVRRTRGSIAASASEIRLPDGRVLPRRDIHSAERASATEVRVRRFGGGSLTVRFESVSDAQTFVDALALETPTAPPPAFADLPPSWRRTLPWTFGIAALGGPAIAASGAHGWSLFVAFVLVMSVAESLGRAVLATTARISEGGVERRGRGANESISFRDVAGIRATGKRVTFDMRDGTTRDWATTSDMAALSFAAEAKQRFERFSPREAPANSGALARGERSVQEWAQWLREEATNDRGYREAALSPDALWEIVENGSATEAERVAAAIALQKTLATPEQRRLRVAADASASPELRVALEAAADPEADAEEALRAVLR